MLDSIRTNLSHNFHFRCGNRSTNFWKFLFKVLSQFYASLSLSIEFQRRALSKEMSSRGYGTNHLSSLRPFCCNPARCNKDSKGKCRSNCKFKVYKCNVLLYKRHILQHPISRKRVVLIFFLFRFRFFKQKWSPLLLVHVDPLCLECLE